MTYVPSGKSLADPRPSIYVEGKFAQGKSGSGALLRDVLILGDKTSDGYATAATVYELKSESDAIYWFGRGSAVHNAWKAVAEAGRGIKISGIAGTESSGNQATGTFTVTGTAVTSGEVVCYVAGKKISVSFASGDANTSVSADLQDAINAVYYLPVTASDSSGTVTVTARNKGTYGNLIRIRCEVTPGSGISCAASAVTLASGSSSGDLTAALAAIANDQYYMQVNCYNDATNIALHKAQLETMETSGIDQVGIAASTSTIASANSQAQTTNSHLYQLACYNKAESLECEFAGWIAGSRVKEENSYYGFNFNNYSLPVRAKGPAVTTDEPSSTDEISALNAGVTPLKTSNGRVQMVRCITTKSLLGATPDYRTRESNIVSVVHAVKYALNTVVALDFSGKKVMDDTDQVQSDRVRQPKHLRAAIVGVIDDFTVGQYRDNLDTSMVDDMVDSIAVVKSTGTLSGQFDLYVMQNLLRVWVIANESSEAY